MSGIGEKIKEVLGVGHSHDSQTSNAQESTHGHDHNKLTKDAPGQHDSTHGHEHSTLAKDTTGHRTTSNRDSAIGGVDPRSPTTVQPHHEPGHSHDPETEAKQATSAAGNYPYWGDLPREQEGEANPAHTTGALHSGSNVPSSTGHSGLEKGALGAGAATAGAGYLAHEHNKPRDDLPATTSSSTPAFEKELPDRTTAKPTSLDNASTAAQVDPLEYPPRYDQGHGKRDAELAGAGLAGAAGAGYLAHKHHDDQNRDKELERSQATPATSSTTTTSKVAPTSAIDQQRYTADPVPQSQQPTTSSTSNTLPLTQDRNTSGAGASDEYHDHKKEEALAGGAGLAGIGAGAGYLASRHHGNENEARRDDRPSTISPSSAQRETTAGGLASGNHDRATGGGIHNTVVGAGSAEDPNSRRFPLDNKSTTVGPQHGTGYGQQDVTRDFSAPTSHNDREKQALAAAAGVGAGAGLAGAEEKHRHNKHNTAAATQPEQTSAHRGTPASSQQPASASTTTSTPAQAAAQQAWSRQDPSATGAGYGQPNPYNNDSHDNDRLKYGAAGAGALAGAGATAAYYGQGKEHDQNPRSAESEKIADRALGGHGSSNANTAGTEMPGSYPQDTSSSKLGSAPAMANTGNTSGISGGQHESGLGAKVLHKCHQCGADNDISQYFDKDASFRMGS